MLHVRFRNKMTVLYLYLRIKSHDRIIVLIVVIIIADKSILTVTQCDTYCFYRKFYVKTRLLKICLKFSKTSINSAKFVQMFPKLFSTFVLPLLIIGEGDKFLVFKKFNGQSNFPDFQ